MFNLQYMAASLGTTIQSGGISIKEEQLTASEMGGKVTVSETPIALDGSLIGWYKKPAETEWKVGTFDVKEMTVPEAKPNEVYCIKYLWHNENAKSLTIKSQYVPAELHVVIINDLFAGDVTDIGSATRYGRLITDIPRLQMEGDAFKLVA